MSGDVGTGTGEASGTRVLRWHDDAARLDTLDWCDPAPTPVLAADSWRVDDGRTLALDAHRTRFLDAAARARVDAAAFWQAAVDAVPATGSWFPRVDLRARPDEGRELVVRLRPSPAVQSTVRLRTHVGPDPRTRPGTKGPDLERMVPLRTDAQAHGADEVVLTSPEGFVVEGGWSAIAWWRGDALCVVHPGLDRVASVTERVLRTLAIPMGVEVREELTEPGELDGLEVWALSALHGPRLVTGWIDGPSVAAEPGRIDAWRRRFAALRR